MYCVVRVHHHHCYHHTARCNPHLLVGGNTRALWPFSGNDSKTTGIEEEEERERKKKTKPRGPCRLSIRLARARARTAGNDDDVRAMALPVGLAANAGDARTTLPTSALHHIGADEMRASSFIRLGLFDLFFFLVVFI